MSEKTCLVGYGDDVAEHVAAPSVDQAQLKLNIIMRNSAVEWRGAWPVVGFEQDWSRNPDQE